MSYIESVQAKGIAILEKSGWDDDTIKGLKECLLDFTSQAFCDEMYKDVDVVLNSEEDDNTLDLVWSGELLDTIVSLYDDISASWYIYAARYEDGKEIEHIGWGVGGSEKVFIYEGLESDPNPEWAFFFYSLLDEYINDLKEANNKVL